MADKKQVVGLCDFLEAIGRAGTIARQQCAEANIAQLQHFLEPADEDGVHAFKTLRVQIGDETQDVPVYGLVPCGHLDMKKLEIEFETVIDINLQSSTETGGNPKIALGMSKGLFSSGTEITVKASFNLADASETAAQIKDKLNKHLAITQET